MILAIDVGNTNIVLGLIENGVISSVAPRITTDQHKTDYEYAVAIENVLDFVGVDATEAEGAILSSVVWPLTSTLISAVKMLTGKTAIVVGAGIKTGLNIAIDDPGTVGADLVVGAVGALTLAKPPLIIIDMGTATTITVVGEGNRFLGGAILPGLRLSMEALSGGTSQLPYISLDPPKKCISTKKPRKAANMVQNCFGRKPLKVSGTSLTTHRFFKYCCAISHNRTVVSRNRSPMTKWG